MAAPSINPSAASSPLKQVDLRLAYSGGEPPARPGRRVENGVLGMAIFLGTETMLFAGLISAFLILRAGSAMWPPPGQPRLPVAVTGINTLILLFSAYSMHRASSAGRQKRQAEMIQWLGVTGALGAVFLMIQGSEWVRLLRFGLTASSSVYGATFYTLIGCHGLHVLAAVIVVLAVLWRTKRSAAAKQSQAPIEVCELYWLFVVAVWPILYALVYFA